MTLRVTVPTSYIHETYLGRPSCPKCGELLMAPEYLYLQADNPGPDKETNWLPAPYGPFYLILRNYAPVPELATALKDPTTFVGPPPVVPVK